MHLRKTILPSLATGSTGLKRRFLTCSLAALLGLPAAFPGHAGAAADGADRQDGQQQSQQMQAEQQEQLSQRQGHIQEGFLPLVGREVRNMNYETIGEIENVVADLDGNMTKVVVSVGGFWDIGDSDVLVPVEKLKMTKKRRYIFYDGTEEELASFPEYRGFLQDVNPRLARNRTIMSPRYYRGDRLKEAYSRKDYDSQAYTGRGDLYYDRAPRSYYGQPHPKVPQEQWLIDDEERQARFDENWSNTDRNTVMASDLVGRTVRNSGGEEIGDIDDVIISRKGRVSVVLDIGEYVGQEDKRVLADLRDLSIDGEGVSYDVSRKELQNDPAYRAESRQAQG